MKCPKCGKEIAEDSKFCEFCGTKLMKKKPNFPLIKWIVIVSIILLSILLFFILLHNNSNKTSTDRIDMNLHGKVTSLVERSFYSYTEEDCKVREQPYEGGFFDGCIFLSLVYTGHMARMFYKKWFLTQVSDCEIQFDENGNIILMKSIWNNGGHINFSYDKNHHLIEMDSRNSAKNQDEGIIRYLYETESKNISVETQIKDGKYGLDTTTVKYFYDTHNNLNRAIMTRIWHNRKEEYIFTYEDNVLCNIYLSDFYPESSGSIQVEYNMNGDISKINVSGTSKLDGRSETECTTTFVYTYDSKNNWIERNGKVCFKDGREYEVKSTRSYVYE